jgi:hypothetical protein
MPAGPSILGFAYFTGTKFLGYSGFAHFLRKKWDDAQKKDSAAIFKIGAIRTAIGVGVGITYWLLALGAETILERFGWGNIDAWWGWLFLAGLIPVRVVEWYWLLRIIFKDSVRGSPQATWSIVWGTIVSYALDAIGIAAAFVIPGGMWVC